MSRNNPPITYIHNDKTYAKGKIYLFHDPYFRDCEVAKLIRVKKKRFWFIDKKGNKTSRANCEKTNLEIGE